MRPPKLVLEEKVRKVLSDGISSLWCRFIYWSKSKLVRGAELNLLRCANVVRSSKVFAQDTRGQYITYSWETIRPLCCWVAFHNMWQDLESFYSHQCFSQWTLYCLHWLFALSTLQCGYCFLPLLFHMKDFPWGTSYPSSSACIKDVSRYIAILFVLVFLTLNVSPYWSKTRIKTTRSHYGF